MPSHFERPLTDDQYLVRRLAAILAADVAGYTRLMGADESGTLLQLNRIWAEVFNPAVARHRGRIAKTMGDGALVEFGSAVDAVTCAVAIQRAMADRNAGAAEGRRIDFRIGINLGEIIITGADIFGDGVNVAARLEGHAPTGGVLISDLVNAQVRGKIDVTFVDAGEISLKNVDRSLRAWCWGTMEDGITPATIRSGAPAIVAPPGPTPVSARPGNLPAVLPALYGRDDDIAALQALIRGQRVVSIVGAGGIGKTSLAQAVAHAMRDVFAGGAWMVELAPLADPALLPTAVAQALDIKLAGVDPVLDELVAGMAQRTLLLVLDNCEHLLDAVATLVQAVVQGAPSVTLMLTSQEPLHLPAEQQYRVTPLAVPLETTVRGAREYGAVALFVARVNAADPRFALDDASLALVIDICRQLDGLPLAIELAAARVATLGLGPVHQKLDARFKLLTGGARARLRRHQTLRATLEWSHGLLSDTEQAVFRRLGVFAGGFTVELAQAVAGDAQLDEWAVLDHLSALVDKSLVVAEPGEVRRYRLLESARAFALERLAAGETAVTLRRHAVAMRNFFERVDGPHLDGELQTEELRALLLPERDNLRAAQAWATGEGGDMELAVALAGCANGLEDFAFETADWLVSLRPQVENGAVGPGVAARYWRAVASANMRMTGRVPRSVQRDAAERASALYRTLGQPRRVFSSLVQLAIHSSMMHDDAAAQRAADEARGVMQPDWPAMLRIRLLRLDCQLARSAGRFSDALMLHRQAVRVAVSTGDWLLETMTRDSVVDLLWQIGPIEDAAYEARGLVNEIRERPLTALDMTGPFTNLIGILSETDQVVEASAAAKETLPLMRRAKRCSPAVWAHLFWRRGQFDTAALMLGATGARDGAELEVNEQRLIDEVRTALAGQMQPDVFASRVAAGAALDDGEMLATIAKAIEAMPHRRP